MDQPTILDIEEIITRWDEILDRTEAGEIFIISVKGTPKVRLEPIPLGDTPLADIRHDLQLPGS